MATADPLLVKRALEHCDGLTAAVRRQMELKEKDNVADERRSSEYQESAEKGFRENR